jgi:hypothetical protein
MKPRRRRSIKLNFGWAAASGDNCLNRPAPSWRFIWPSLNRIGILGRKNLTDPAPQPGDLFVIFRSALLATLIFGVSTMAQAETASSEQMGTKEQREACAPDVRKFCHKVKEADGPDAYLQCLELNRSALSARCVGMLQNYGK